MSKQEIIEGNKLIAEFMGCKSCFSHIKDKYGYIQTVDGYLVTGKCNIGNHQEDEYENFAIENLKYHSSWDWLMPVIERIGNLKSLEKDGEWFNFVIQNSKVPTNTYYTHIGRVGEYSRNLGNVSSGKSSSLIESNLLCIVEFIKWYNSCQKEK